MTSSLSPAVVAAIDDLELAARLVVEGLRAGGHRSPFHGFSAEFEQHRPYRLGDDLKYLDWKILARTDRLYSRQFRETTNMSVMLVLDGSASMAYPDDSRSLSKFRYASIIAASLAYLVIAQGDAAGLMCVSGEGTTYLPARGGRPHLRSLIARIDRLRAGGAWRPDQAIVRGAELLKRRGVVVVLSDFYDEEDETRRVMRRVAHGGHDVAMLQILSADERTLSVRGDVEFEDAESGERRLLDASAAKREYEASMAAFVARCASEARRDHVDYALFTTDVAPETALRRYLITHGEHHPGGHGSVIRGIA